MPTKLFDHGFVEVLRGGELKRLMSLYRLANYNYGDPEIRMGLKELARLDGVSERTSWLAMRKLQEWKLIEITKTRPHTYRLRPPLFLGET